jgi:predicted MFS family arabinose efflux permease
MNPRERAKYGGLMGAVFGVSAVLGPLLGGFLTEHASWHWTFWINVPLGIAAFGIVYFVLHLPPQPRVHKVDYLGMSMMIPAVSALILTTTWGGSQYDWNSPIILSLIAAFFIFSFLFVLVERRAVEPLIPLSLFKNRTFTLAALIGLLLGAGMFAAASYLPTYLQIVRNVGITTSGLLMLPMVSGILVTSIIAGRITSNTGHYRIFPILGMALAATGVGLMSTMDETTSAFTSGAFMAILGGGLGLVIQTLILVVQNSVPAKDIGVATSSNNFFREIGISLGVSIFGSIFASRLSERLGSGANSGGEGQSTFTPESLSGLAAPVREHIVHSYVQALTPAFIILVPVLALGFVLAFFLPHLELGHASGIQRRAQESEETV